MIAPLPAAGPERSPTGRLRPVTVTLLVLGAVGSFHLAFVFAPLGWLVLGYLGCLFELRRLPTARQAFYIGMLVGLGVFVPETGFLWGIFGPAAIPLWCILAFFHGLFLLLLHRVEVRLGSRWSMWLAPVLWCGIEYFRSEVWWLRFTWFTAGSVFNPPLELGLFAGIYGGGLIAFECAILLRRLVARTFSKADGILWGALHIILLPALATVSNGRQSSLKVAGIQLEFPGIPEVLTALDQAAKAHPETELLMLSEYTFDGPVPDSVKLWCKRNRKWLVAGGKEIIQPGAPGSAEVALKPKFFGLLQPTGSVERYYNTAFVIGTNGDVVFSQAKSVPIQFFKDGEPAREQRVWDSPWGKLGIAICYDLSYRRVMDELIRQGARGLLIPTMDVEQWGKHEHRLNARMAWIRAAEYGVPIFRVASSGISQLVNASGREQVTTAYPGPGEIIAGELRLRGRPAGVPPDAWLAPTCTVGTGCVIFGLSVLAWRDRAWRKGQG
ncbi:MAG TPA: nitrilase-related carbon-nitrogen hydrolase [Candidatus Limnocylindria bacterium]|nr:nitrilase-related carbon-nitrogen hydrolase [Candidatus Limnocylindria bacterium]